MFWVIFNESRKHTSEPNELYIWTIVARAGRINVEFWATRNNKKWRIWGFHKKGVH